MRRLFALMMCAVSLGATAQLFSKQASSLMDIPDGYCVSTEIVATHEDGVLSGMTTYRLYLQCENEQDYLVTIGGIAEPTNSLVEGGPLVLNASSGTWYNSGCNLQPTAAGVAPFLVEYVPTLAYDSWVTIGAANSGEIPANDIGSIWGDINPNPQFAAPESFDEECVDFEGMNVIVDDPIGGAWYVPFPGSYDEDNTAFAHEDLRILIMQITTSSEFTGQAFFQIFMNADQSQETRGVLEFSSCVSSGCTDESACNYDIGALQDDGSCDYSCCPGPGCCDVGTEWSWESNTCIVTNPSDSNFDGCIQLNDLLDLLTAYGDCGAEESAWQCGDPLEYQGYDYETVQIGEQCWFAENLQCLALESGSSLEVFSESGEWASTDSAATWIYGSTVSCWHYSPEIDACDTIQSLEEYGRLYNGFVIEEGNLCPAGWNIPAVSHWQELAALFGGMEIAATQLKSVNGWGALGGDGDNQSGLDVKPSGMISPNGQISYDAGYNALFWTPSGNTESGDVIVFGTQSEIDVQLLDKNCGLSIRCIKNAE